MAGNPQGEVKTGGSRLYATRFPAQLPLRMSLRRAAPLCLIIAGPNGAGKTTFAREFLPREAGILNFVNADLIAAGLAPLRPAQVAIGAGRIFLHEIDRLAGQGESFSFESTLSGMTYLPRLRRWRAAGYRIEIIYLRLDSVSLALRRIAARVREGGHDVAATDVIRRFERSWHNFRKAYAPLCDSWWVYDAGVRPPALREKS